jgi:hypothetical protein
VALAPFLDSDQASSRSVGATAIVDAQPLLATPPQDCRPRAASKSEHCRGLAANSDARRVAERRRRICHGSRRSLVEPSI